MYLHNFTDFVFCVCLCIVHFIFCLGTKLYDLTKVVFNGEKIYGMCIYLWQDLNVLRYPCAVTGRQNLITN